MTFSQFWQLMRARWRMVVAGAVIGLALAGLWILLSPPSYEATAQVLVDVRAPETVGNQSVANQLASDYLTTQLDILRSDRLSNHVTKLLDKSGSTSAAAIFDEYDVKHLTLVPNAGSRVISIRYAAPGANEAAIIANAFATAYSDISLDLQADPARQSAKWYELRALAVREQLRTAQQRLSDRQRSLGITADQDTLDTDSARLGGLSGQLAAAEALRASLATRSQGDALPDTMASPVASGIQAELAKLEAQRQQLTAFAGPNNLDVVQLDRQIATLRQKLSEQQALIGRSARVAAEQAMSGVRNLDAAVAAQKNRVISARNNRSDVAALQQDVDTLKTTYEQIVARRSQLNLLGEGSGTNVTLLSPAQPPIKPAWPKPIIMLPLGLVIGTLLASIAAIAVGLLDQRLISPEDFDVWLGIPYLGGIRSERANAGSFRLAGVMPRQLFAPGQGRSQ